MKPIDDAELAKLGLEGVRAAIEVAHQKIDELTELLKHERNGLKNFRECERAMVRPTREHFATPALHMHYALNYLPRTHPRSDAIRARVRVEAEKYQRANGMEEVTG